MPTHALIWLSSSMSCACGGVAGCSSHLPGRSAETITSFCACALSDAMLVVVVGIPAAAVVELLNVVLPVAWLDVAQPEVRITSSVTTDAKRRAISRVCQRLRPPKRALACGFLVALTRLGGSRVLFEVHNQGLFHRNRRCRISEAGMLYVCHARVVVQLRCCDIQERNRFACRWSRQTLTNAPRVSATDPITK